LLLFRHVLYWRGTNIFWTNLIKRWIERKTIVNYNAQYDNKSFHLLAITEGNETIRELIRFQTCLNEFACYYNPPPPPRKKEQLSYVITRNFNIKILQHSDLMEIMINQNILIVHIVSRNVRKTNLGWLYWKKKCHRIFIRVR
jgi:hypothetical protein